MPTAYCFRAGSRVRLEIANADSPLTDAVFSHPYTPDKVGDDTIYHDATRPSRLLLPVLPASAISGLSSFSRVHPANPG
jgi:predicted acyl esterase